MLSIVIVAYRSAGELDACLRSLPGELGGAGVEVVVVDNSRNCDHSADVVHFARPGSVYLVPDANLGFGKANNLGLASASGSTVLFLNPDTVCNAEALLHCLQRLQDPAIGLVSPKLVLADGSMDPACRRSIPTLWDGFCRACGLAARFPDKAWASGYNLTHLPENGSYPVGAINGAFMMARRSTLEAVALPSVEGRPQVFDERHFMYGDDLDLCIRIAKAGFKVLYDGSHSITHLKGVSVAKDLDRMSSAIFDANRDVYLRHFNPRNSTFIAWKWRLAFAAWKRLALLRARVAGHRKVRPL